MQRAGLISKGKKKIYLIRAPVADKQEEEFKNEKPNQEGEIQMEIN